MATRACPKCGAAVGANAMFCPNCGSTLPAVAAGPAPPTAPTYPAQGYAAPGTPPTYPGGPPPVYPGYAPYDWGATERKKRIDRTRTGALLLAIGSVLSWIPIIVLIGGLLILIGAILVILGRKAFSSRHATFVVLSVVIFLISLAAAVAIAVPFALAITSATTGGQVDTASVAGAFQQLVYGAAAVAAFGGVANVLFVHELENRTGKYLLYAGYAAAVAVEIVVAYLSLALFATLPPRVTLVDILNLQGQLGTYQLLRGVPGVIFAAAFYLAYGRIQRGEIPQPGGAAPPTMPWAGTYAPPPPPSPPQQ